MTKPKKKDEIMDYINGGNNTKKPSQIEEKEEISNTPTIKEEVKLKMQQPREVERKSLTLDEEIDKGLRFIVAEEKKNHSKVIENLIKEHLIKNGYDKKHDLKLT
ncbi:MAG: hypothetical protein ACI9CD_000866 [Candidatus Deianiraeaceae bacterium]|jgi:hypothetical protein